MFWQIRWQIAGMEIGVLMKAIIIAGLSTGLEPP
jgi:hypothetical protein